MASQRVTLYKKIFEEEFDIDVLSEAGVIKKHFMLHTSQAPQIQESWR